MGPCPGSPHIFRLRSHLLDAFEAGVHRLDETGLVEGYSIGNLFDAALDDPVHGAHVLGETASGGFIPGRDADFLVDRALGVEFAPAIEALRARNVMENDDAVAGAKRVTPTPTAATMPAVSCP